MNKRTSSKIEKDLNREQVPSFTQKTLPPAPFPRKYVHCVFADVQDARQAAQALFVAGYEEQNIHVLERGDFVDAISKVRSPLGIFSSTDHDEYLREAHSGRTFLVVRPTNRAQLNEIRDVLAPHGATLVTYIDTWTKAKLLP